MGAELRVGIMGPGNIFRRVMKDLGRAEDVCVVAVGSRSFERARDAADAYGIPHAFGSYEQLAACPEVDLVYVATLHNTHKALSILAMEHGKHVLCEKPMALNGEEVREMIDCARKNNVFLMEAMWTRFFPAMVKLRELIAQGAIGEIRHMTANFAFPGTVDPASRIYSRELAGGALLDLGVYTLEAATMILGASPCDAQSFASIAETGVDAQEAIQLRYESGATAQLFSAVNTHGSTCAMYHGTKGYLRVDEFYHPTRLIQKNSDGSSAEYAFPDENEGFRHEFAHVRDCIRLKLAESPIMPLAETEQVARLSTSMRREWGVRYPEEQE